MLQEIDQWANTIQHGDARYVLKKMPAESVDCIITSPPYYRQRNYSAPMQIGGECSPAEYVANLGKVFRECQRVLTPNGTFWLNLGDKYLNGDLLGMPWRVALSLKDDGWILRSDIIWQKSNAMPSSVKSRPTIDHEYIFLFVKNQRYYYDADAIREPHITFSPQSKMKGGRNHFGKKNGTPENGKNQGNSNLHDGRWDQAFHPKGRNRRTVWQIPLSKFRGVHFAVFPEKLVEICIAAGCPKGGLVLDPFVGSGTTAVVAQRTGRKYVGIEISRDYCDLSSNRLRQEGLL